MLAVDKNQDQFTQTELIDNAIGTYEEYSELIDSKNDKLYMCMKVLKAHSEQTGQFTVEEVSAAKSEALIQVSAEKKFCTHLANSKLPECSVQAKALLPDIEEAIKAIAV